MKQEVGFDFALSLQWIVVVLIGMDIHQSTGVGEQLNHCPAQRDVTDDDPFSPVLGDQFEHNPFGFIRDGFKVNPRFLDWDSLVDPVGRERIGFPRSPDKAELGAVEDGTMQLDLHFAIALVLRNIKSGDCDGAQMVNAYGVAMGTVRGDFGGRWQFQRMIFVRIFLWLLSMNKTVISVPIICYLKAYL